MIRIRLRTVGLLAALASLLAFSASWGSSDASAQGPVVSVGSLNANVGVLSKVEVRVLGIGAPGMAAWTIDVHYDPALVTIAACAASQNGICNAHYNATTVRVTGTNIYGLQGDTTLASIALACNVAGTGQLELNIDVLADATIGGPRPIVAAPQNGAVTCTSDAAPTATSTLTQAQPTATPPVSEPKLPGDANCSGVVNPIDAELILQYEARSISSIPCPNDADFNHDGAVNSIDAVLTLQRSAGLF
jgi:hypothetical protein